MQKAVFSLKPKIIFGPGSINDIGDEIRSVEPNPKVFICTDAGIVKSGISSQVTAVLDDQGIQYALFSDVVPNPKMETVDQALAAMKKFGGNVIVAIGGGSPMDTAKAVAGLYTNGGKISDYEGFELMKKPAIPIIAIPTTYGTGSEVGSCAVITNEEKNYKMMIISDCLNPKAAIVDPDLLVALPPKIAASTAIDALTHAIESYTCLRANPVTDALNIHAIKLIAQNGPQAIMSNCNLEATANMAIASTLAGAAMGNTGLGLVHAIAHALGGVADMPHGVANSILLPYVMRFNLPAVPEKYQIVGVTMGADVAKLCPLEAAKVTCTKVIPEFCQLAGVPSKFREVGLDKKLFDMIADYAMKDGNFPPNPRVTTKEDILAILEEAY
ncbi:MAG TPA: iron-containing alcohol dehydrogenase [Clostridia bacterium]|nr:iron-containing alcohol dehydrogenase [Clostridia bacterium]